MAAFLVLQFGFRFHYVSSRSMEPTLQPRDALVGEVWCYRLRSPRRGEIAIFRQGKGLLIKRVVAVEGDRIELSQGQFRLNGQALDRLFTPGEIAPRVVAPGRFFALGDNRSNSVDSRGFGDVPLSDLVARAGWRIWPPSRWSRDIKESLPVGDS